MPIFHSVYDFNANNYDYPDAIIEQRECTDTVEPTCDESQCPEDSNTVCACLSTDSSICQTFPNQCVLDARNCLSKPGCMFLTNN